jgi:cytochrome c-type biogenesis protein CcmH/NrfF
MKKRWTRGLTIRAFCAVLAIASVGFVLTHATEAVAIENAPPWAYAMAHDLMSPYCPGRTLAECPSPQATTLRFEILMQAAAGASEDEVREMLASRFGDVLLAAPRAEGWGLSAYAIPIVFFVLGGPVVFWIIRRLASEGRGEPVSAQGMEPASSSLQSEPPSHPDAELERQLEKELADF